jgi:zinc transport system permease protein
LSELLATLQSYFAFPFVRHAIIVGTLIALCSSLLGVTLVLKRMSFIGDGLSHVAFGAMAVASVLGMVNETPLVMGITIATAILLLRSGAHLKIKGDAFLAMFSVGALGVGYLLLNLFSQSANLTGDVCSTLFGSTAILTLTMTDVILCVVMSVVVVCIFLLFYHQIFAVTFDENFARATGVKAGAYNLLIAVVTAIIIVLAMNLVGSLLISSLVIFPALSSMRIFKNFKAVILCSAVTSVVTAITGIIVAILSSTPVGATIVVVDIVVFLLFWMISKCLGGIIR